MKKKNGFTLIELLAVIVILSVLLIISIPKLIGEIKNNKSDALNNYKGMIVSAARNYVIDYNLDAPLTIPLTTLCDMDYIDCPIIDPTTENNMGGYVNIDSNKNYSYSEDTPEYATTYEIIFNLVGGVTTQSIHAGYVEGERIDLVPPTKNEYTFNGWSAGCTLCLVGNTYTVGSADDTITASWKIDPSLTVNLIGGSTTQIFKSRYAPGTLITLTNPIKAGSVFDYWSYSGTGTTLNNGVLTMGSANTTITANWKLFADMFTYTGTYSIVDDGDGNWRIKFLTSGTFTPVVNMTIDVFLVGGGGGGSNASGSYRGGGGGGSGYTGTWSSISITASQGYPIVVGDGGLYALQPAYNGSPSSAFGYSVNGGNGGGLSWNCNGGSGGSGGGGGSYTNNYLCSGTGGSNGASGGNSTACSPSIGGSGLAYGGSGQGSTTREFGEATGTLYAGGGGAGMSANSGSTNSAGGAGGGGTGGVCNQVGASGTANTGGGGGGGGCYDKIGGIGGSGIVIIRNHR